MRKKNRVTKELKTEYGHDKKTTGLKLQKAAGIWKDRKYKVSDFIRRIRKSSRVK